MTPEQYLSEAEAHYQAGRFGQAAAAASLAAAVAAVAARSAESPELYLGEHRPQLVEWCGKCSIASRGVRRGKPCPRCNTNRLRVRPCRYCGTHVESKPGDHPEAPRIWVDARGAQGCPKAPDPLAPVPEPTEPEPDIYPDSWWGRFLENWSVYSSQKDRPVTASELVAEHDLRGWLPKTRFSERPHPKHLDDWLRARAGQDHDGHTISEAGTQDGATLWTVTASPTP